MVYEKRVYYKDDDILVWLENIEEQIFLHLVVTNMTKSVVKKIRDKWEEVAIRAVNAGYDELFVYTKDERFVRLIGDAEYLGPAQDYGVYKWDLA